jgi:hypothetical protein
MNIIGCFSSSEIPHKNRLGKLSSKNDREGPQGERLLIGKRVMGIPDKLPATIIPGNLFDYNGETPTIMNNRGLSLQLRAGRTLISGDRAGKLSP